MPTRRPFPSIAQVGLPYGIWSSVCNREGDEGVASARGSLPWVRRSVPRLPVIATVAFVLVALTVPTASAAAATRCPATFHVLHNDHIGSMSLPAGQYTVTVNRMTCAGASRLFSRFLEDYDGTLPFPWSANPRTRTFTRGSGPTSFSVRRGATPPAPPGPPTPSNPTRCPGTFSVLSNTSIGPLAFPRGSYQLRLLGPRLSCQRASQWFAQFLDDFEGDLPAPWTLGAPPGSSVGAVFNDLPAGTGFSALRVGSRTGGGGHTPSGGTRCPGTFRVLHNDHIGSLYLPRGLYVVSLLQGDTLSCAQASTQFTRFLDATRVPRPWVIDAASGTFTRGIGSTTGFRIKPARGAIR